MSDTDIHDYQDDSFPKMKSPMDVEDHPDNNLPKKTYQDVGTSGASLIDRYEGPRDAEANRARRYKGF